jgi:hypothetical protein
MSYGSTLKEARKVLESLWRKALLRGHCWGKKTSLKGRVDNPYADANIIMANRYELVAVSQKEDGTLVVHEFMRVNNTILGEKIRESLNKEQLDFLQGSTLDFH